MSHNGATGDFIILDFFLNSRRVFLKHGDEGFKKNLIPIIQKEVIKLSFLRFDDTALFSVVC